MSYRSVAALFSLLAFAVPAACALDIVAHRGASHDAPENTLASEKLAWKQGADAVENDIHLTRDGKIIVIHDQNTKRTTGRAAAVADLTLAELRQLDAGGWKGPQFAGEKLPTLAEQIELIPPGRRMFVEIKTGPEIVPELQRILTATGATEKNITIISFHYDALQAVREKLPHLPTQYLVGYQPPGPKKPGVKKQPTLDEVIAQAQAARLTGLDLQHTWPLTVDDVKKIKAAGLQLHVWTVDDPEVARHWAALGAQSITTNRPAFLREHLRR